MKYPFFALSLLFSLNASAASITSSDLSGHKWCHFKEAEMKMLELYADGTASVSHFSLERSSNGRIEAELKSAARGHWSVNNEFFTTKLNGETETLKASLKDEGSVELSNGESLSTCD